jgi:hypothetical protein
MVTLMVARIQRGLEGERRLLLGMGRAARDDLLFPRWDGQIRSPHWLTQTFQQAMAALKIKGVTPMPRPCLAAYRLRDGCIDDQLPLRSCIAMLSP